MKRYKKLAALTLFAALGAALYATGAGRAVYESASERLAAGKAENKDAGAATYAPAVSVTPATTRDFVETVLVTGSLVPRDEILVAPEIDGLRVVDLKVDEGDRVTKGQVLATLVADTLEAQIAQSDAELVRANANIARAKSQITDAQARASETGSSLDRAKPLRKQGWIAESALEVREAAARSAAAQLVAANDGLKVAEAEKAQIEARRKELDWRRSNVEVKSPSDGIVSRRAARIGGMTVAAGEPMFRIIARGEVELDAEVAESRLHKIAPGQKAVAEVPGAGSVNGSVRLVSPEVDKTTRLGRVRVFLGENAALRIGAFGRATIETATDRAIAIPASAILYDEDGTTSVQVVENNVVRQRAIAPGLKSGALVAIKSGLSEGDLVVTKAGTFLRDGDAVRPIEPASTVSERADGAVR